MHNRFAQLTLLPLSHPGPRNGFLPQTRYSYALKSRFIVGNGSCQDSILLPLTVLPSPMVAVAAKSGCNPPRRCLRLSMAKSTKVSEEPNWSLLKFGGRSN